MRSGMLERDGQKEKSLSRFNKVLRMDNPQGENMNSQSMSSPANTNPKVDEWFQSLDHPLKSTMLLVRNAILQADKRMTEQSSASSRQGLVRLEIQMTAIRAIVPVVYRR